MRALKPVASATGSLTAKRLSPSAATDNELSQWPRIGFSK